MHTILVADDSVTIQRAVEIVFDKEPFTVIKAGSGQEAMTRAREMKPNLVLVDHTMNDQSGYDLAAALRADPATESIPVLLLSAAANPFDEARGRAAGVVGHLPKPFDCQSLLDRVRTILGVAATAPGTFTSPTPATTSVLGSSLPRPPSLGGLPRPPGPLGGGIGPTFPPRTATGTSPATSATPASAATPIAVPATTTRPPTPASRELDPFGFGNAMAVPTVPPQNASTPPAAAPRPSTAAAVSVTPAPAVSSWGTPTPPAPAAPVPLARATTQPSVAALSSPQSMSTPAAASGWQAMAPGAGMSSTSAAPVAPAVSALATAPVPATLAAAPVATPSTAPTPSWLPSSTPTPVPAVVARPATPIKAGDDLMEISDIDVADVDPSKVTAKLNLASVSAALGSPAAPATPASPAAAVITRAVDAVVAAAAPAVAHTGVNGVAPSKEVLSQEARSIIERIAWEVVPELAEVIIREEIQRLLKAK
ncbi:MAG: response regulator [Deltaproteobacteria bacterium]|nr:response regulator [Deltaproteobacteria bacterium]